MDQVTVKYGGSLLQLVVGDKGNYIHIVFGALLPIMTMRSRLCLRRWSLRSCRYLYFIANLQVGLAYGQMRVGAYGGAAHRTYGAMGDKTNLAARLMQAVLLLPPVMERGALCDASIYEATRHILNLNLCFPFL